MAYYDDPRYVRRDADQSLTVSGRRQPIDWTAEGPSELSPARIDRRNPDHSSAGISIQRRSPSPVGRSSARRPARRHRSPSSSTDYSSPERIARQENVQAIFSPDFDQKDVTLHFTMDIAEDIEGALEELARLKRLGHFKEALEYVATHLDHHLNLPLVAIEYADLLRQQGAHRQLHDLRNRRHLLPPLKSKFIFGTDMKPPNLYRTHFELIEQSSELALQGLPRKQVLLIKNENILRYLNKRVPSWFISAYVRPNEDVSLDSTELQILRNELLLFSDIQAQGLAAIPKLVFYQWKDLHDSLLWEGRIWELCDLISAMFQIFDPNEVSDHLLDMHEKPNREDEDPVDRILQGLSMDEYDEPTELALLTLSVELVYAVHYWSGSRGGDLAIVATRCLQYASTHAALIQEHSPWLVKTRPYLQWVLAKERFDRIWNTTGSVKEQERPRSTHTTGTTLYKWSLPRYIPKETENPGWPSPDTKFPPNQTLQGVLEAARELGDYKTEAACLTELICRVEDPRELLSQLGHLQQAIQGDRFGYLNTCISRYLLAKDEASIRTLIADLEQTASQLCTTPEDDACPAIRFDELRVKSALYRSLPGHSPEADRYKNLADTLSIDLPAPFRPLDTRGHFLDYDDDDDWTRPEFTETEPRIVISEPGRRRTSYRARDTDALPNTNTPKANLVRSTAQGARFRERERSLYEDPDEERFERIPKGKQEVRGRTSRDDETKPKTKSSEEVGKDVVADNNLNPIIREAAQEDTEISRPQNSGKKNLTSVEVDEDSSEDEDVLVRHSGALDSE